MLMSEIQLVEKANSIAINHYMAFYGDLTPEEVIEELKRVASNETYHPLVHPTLSSCEMYEGLSATHLVNEIEALSNYIVLSFEGWEEVK
jgi:hypothetical protein